MLNLKVNEAKCELQLTGEPDSIFSSVCILGDDRRFDEFMLPFGETDLSIAFASARETTLLSNLTYNLLTEAGLVVQCA